MGRIKKIQKNKWNILKFEKEQNQQIKCLNEEKLHFYSRNIMNVNQVSNLCVF